MKLGGSGRHGQRGAESAAELGIGRFERGCSQRYPHHGYTQDDTWDSQKAGAQPVDRNGDIHVGTCPADGGQRVPASDWPPSWGTILPTGLGDGGFTPGGGAAGFSTAGWWWRLRPTELPRSKG